jgi:predicted negative regulator of RcsB-dependent stress response
MESRGQYQDAIAALEGFDFSGPKTHLILQTMLRLARCYCLYNEYAKAEPLLKQVIGTASEKQLSGIDDLVLSAKQMMASAERMKAAK